MVAAINVWHAENFAAFEQKSAGNPLAAGYDIPRRSLSSPRKLNTKKQTP
jgi:hypothetical protein